MAEIKEDYVSFEIAKLLKEKGFDEGCSFVVNTISKGMMPVSWPTTNSDIEDEKASLITLPTLQMAMKWLREVHDIHIELNWDKGNQLYSFNIWKPGKYQPEISSLDLWRIYKDDNYPGEWNYEQTCETAIKYCFENLI